MNNEASNRMANLRQISQTMSSKRFRGKLCAYCCELPAITGDHVFAREFFLPDARANLPQVPVCDRCNNYKSKLEHYLTALLPFGGLHSHALENLADQVPRRLTKNQRLARELNTGRGRIWHIEGEIIQPVMTLPLDPQQTCELFAQIGRGLTYHHWGTYLKPDHVSEALFLSDYGRKFFARLFTMKAANRVQQDLGNATVSYDGVQATDNPQLTLWRIQFYGGIVVSGDPKAPNTTSTEIAVITGPKRIVHLLTQRSS
jgi:hypothetical protein